MYFLILWFFFLKVGGGGGSQPNEIENQPNEICSHLSEKASKGTFLKPEKLQNHSNERKGKEKKKERGEGKEEKKKKAMVALLVFTIATLEIVFGRKILLEAKGLFGDNVIRNPARNTIR